MTEHIRVTNVHPSFEPLTWTIRGELIQSGKPFKAETTDRTVMASCVGARAIGWPVQVTLNESGRVIAVSVL